LSVKSLLKIFATEPQSLDAIASGRQNWEHYIIGWHRDYLAIALQKATNTLESQPLASKVISHKESEVNCPSCGKKMLEIPSNSKKLHTNYFLKCSCCETVMFYNKWNKNWEVPRTKEENNSPVTLTLTEHLCPVCKEKLAVRDYEKDGQKKRMLVCSSPKAKGDKKHEGVAYFESRGVFWSKQYGEISFP
jgi:DNA topoisomerase-1